MKRDVYITMLTFRLIGLILISAAALAGYFVYDNIANPYPCSKTSRTIAKYITPTTEPPTKNWHYGPKKANP